MIEIYKDIKDYEGCFQISNLGNIRSLDRYIKHYRGGLKFQKGRDNKSMRMTTMGYWRTTLKMGGVNKTFFIHQLVANAFLDKPSDHLIINHIDGIKTNNRIDNLEWTTHSGNVQHAVKLRLIKTKLTDEQALKIKYSNGTTRGLGKEYGVSSGIIWRIKNGLAYKHLN